jgi:preprotein translocase subunit SecG
VQEEALYKLYRLFIVIVIVIVVIIITIIIKSRGNAECFEGDKNA